MKAVKITFWATILLLLAVFIYQNQNFFFQANQSFRINLIFAEFKTPEITSALIFLLCILAGAFVTYVLSIPVRMTSRKQIKLLQKAVDSQLKEISSLNKKLADSNIDDTMPVPENIEKPYSNYR